MAGKVRNILLFFHPSCSFIGHRNPQLALIPEYFFPLCFSFCTNDEWQVSQTLTWVSVAITGTDHWMDYPKLYERTAGWSWTDGSSAMAKNTTSILPPDEPSNLSISVAYNGQILGIKKQNFRYSRFFWAHKHSVLSRLSRNQQLTFPQHHAKLFLRLFRRSHLYIHSVYNWPLRPVCRWFAPFQDKLAPGAGVR